MCVRVSVRSINAWVSNSSLNGGSTWRPVQSFSSGPVRSCHSWSPTPCQLVSIQSVRETIHSIVYVLALRSSISCQLWSPTLCRVVWIVFDFRSIWRVSVYMSGLALFTSLKLCARYIMYVYMPRMQLAGSLPQCRLVSILDRADWSCDSNSVRQINHSAHAWSPARHPGESPLLVCEVFQDWSIISHSGWTIFSFNH